MVGSTPVSMEEVCQGKAHHIRFRLRLPYQVVASLLVMGAPEPEAFVEYGGTQRLVAKCHLREG